MNSEIVRIEGVHKYFGQGPTALKVLRGVDLVVRTGEIVLVMGPSGSGKSTLLSLIGAIDKPTEGRIGILGTDVTSLDTAAVEQMRNRSIGFVFQFHYLLPEFNVVENIMMPGIVAGVPLKKARARALELLEMIGFANRATELPDRLSGGERQKVALARAFFSKPTLVIADEPTGSLDAANVDVVMSIVRRERDESGRTFVIATHDQRLTAIADRIIRLEEGACREEPHEVQSRNSGVRIQNSE